MNEKNNFLDIPKIPLYYSIPILAVLLVAFSLLVFVFKIEVPQIYLQPAVLDSVNVSSCGVLDKNNTYYILNQSINFDSSSGLSTCITIVGNNSILDGEFKHVISGTGAADEYIIHILGENVSVFRMNLTNSRIGVLTSNNNSYVHNNFINATNGTGIAVGIGSSYSKVINNLIVDSVSGIAVGRLVNGLSSYGHNVENNTIFGNSININNPLHNGFDFGISMTNVLDSRFVGNKIYKKNTLQAVYVKNSINNIISNNILIGPFNNGINYIDSKNNLISNLEIYNSSNSAIYVYSTNNDTQIHIKNSIISNTSSPYYDLEIFPVYSSNNFSRVFVENSSIKSYRFNQTMLTFSDGDDVLINFTKSITTNGSNLNNSIKTGSNYVEVNSNLDNGLNKSALITFFGIPTNMINPLIFRDGVLCSLNVCKNLTSLNAGNVLFNVTGWSNYTINYSGLFSTTAQTLNIEEPDSDDRYTLGSFPRTFEVLINSDGNVKFSLNNGSTNLSMVTDDNRTFTYLQNSLSLGDYTFWAYGNFSNGTKISKFHNFRVVVNPPSTTSGGSSSGGSSGGGGTTGNGTTSGTSGTTGTGSSGGTTYSGGSSGGTTFGGGGNSNFSIKTLVYWMILSIIIITIIILVVLIVRTLRAKIAEKNDFNISGKPSGQLMSNLK